MEERPTSILHNCLYIVTSTKRHIQVYKSQETGTQHISAVLTIPPVPPLEDARQFLCRHLSLSHIIKAFADALEPVGDLQRNDVFDLSALDERWDDFVPGRP